MTALGEQLASLRRTHAAGQAKIAEALAANAAEQAAVIDQIERLRQQLTDVEQARITLQQQVTELDETAASETVEAVWEMLAAGLDTLNAVSATVEQRERLT